MLRRLFSSSVINKLNCYDCRLYNKKTKLCKINRLNATDNRIDDNICGISAKKFWILDKTNLIKSKALTKYSNNIELCGFISLPCIIFYDYNMIYLSFSSFIIAGITSDISRKYEEKYLNDNDINNDYL